MYASMRVASWSRRYVSVGIVACLLLLPSVAPAATIGWTSLAGDLLWSNAGNWTAGGPPGSGDNAAFGGTLGGTSLAYFAWLNVNTTITNLAFQDTDVTLLGQGGSNNLTVNGTFAWTNNSVIGTNFSQTVGTTTLNGATTLSGGSNGPGVFAGVLGRNIVNNAAASITSSSNNTFSRQSGISTSSWTNSSSGSLTKTNSGTTTIAWDITNNGTLRANDGTINLTGAFSQGSGGNTRVEGGATINLGGGAFVRNVQGRLRGSGTITAASGISHSNGLITPGGTTSAGTLTIGTNLTLADTSTLTFDIGPLGGAADDKLVVNGNLTLPSSATPLTLNIQGNPADMFAREGELVPIIDYSGTLTGDASSFVIGSVPAGTLQSLYGIVIDTANTQVLLRVPEPSTIAMGLSLGLVGLVFAWRKRKAAR